MKVIFKYRLDNNIIELPKGAKVLHVGIQQDELYAWALVDKATNGEAPPAKVPSLRVIGTGHLIPDFDTLGEFLGTHMSYGGNLVFHVYKIKEEEAISNGEA